MQSNFEQKLKGLLKKNEKFIDKEGNLIKSVIINCAIKIDKEMISLLIKDKEVKDTFFEKIEDLWIFNINKFVDYIQDKNVFSNSVTKFEAQIGLNIDNKFLGERGEVALVWPFKDCVLEGGMTKEDQDRDEIFFNEILAKDEIDRLEEPKVLTNFKKYTAKGEEKVKDFTRDENGTIKDNLIIRGNNFLALHSLKKEFAGKVKMIYIDPPYNTENDSFSYNDQFTHSTWLTFMKNRLEVAKELLTEDGTIFVQLDWHESHYCKILLDEIFGRDHLINEIIWCYAGPGSPEMRQFNRKHDTIFWYRKGENWIFNKDEIRMPYKDPNQSFRKAFDSGEGWTEKDLKELREKGKVPEDWWEFSVAARLRVDQKRRTGYLTEKPLKLMERIIKTASKEKDLILDFFAGAGTTGYVASELNRQFILIEQLEDTQQKLKKRFEDIAYISCELMKYNEDAMDKIQDAKDTKILLKIWEEMCDKYFLRYDIIIRNFDYKKFESMSLKQQKEELIKMLNKNQLYVNLSEIEDSQFKISKEDKELNKKFYKED